MKRKLSIFFWAIVSMLGAVAATPPPIQYTPMTTNAPAGMTNAVRNIASLLSRDMDANNKQITNAYFIGTKAIGVSNVMIGQNLIVDGPSAFIGNMSVSGAVAVVGSMSLNGVPLGGGGTSSVPILVARNVTELLSAVTIANSTNAQSRHILLTGNTTYQLGDPIVINNGGVFIEGVMGMDSSGNDMSSVIEQTNPTKAAIEWVVSGTENITGGGLKSIRFVGHATNDLVPGVFVAASPASYNTLQGKLEQLHVSGFGAGILLSNTVHVTIDSCTSISNLFASIRAENVAGELSILHPHIGWGLSTNSWCIYIGSPYFAGQCMINGMGGEMGIGSKFLYMNPGVGHFTWIGGNYEAQNTNISPIISLTNMAECGFYGMRIAGSGTATVFDLGAGDMSAYKLFCSVQGFAGGLLADIHQHGGIDWFPKIPGGQSVKTMRSRYDATTKWYTNDYDGNIPSKSEANGYKGEADFYDSFKIIQGKYDGVVLGADLAADPASFTVNTEHGLQVIGSRYSSASPGVDSFTMLTYDAYNTAIEMGLGGGKRYYTPRVGPTSLSFWASPAEGSNSSMIMDVTASSVQVKTNLIVDGVLSGDGSGLTGVIAVSSNANLNPYTNDVWFKNGTQQGFIVGADASGQTATTNTEKNWFMTAPGYHDETSRIGLFRFLTTETNQAQLRIGSGEGFGGVNSVEIYCATNSSETDDGSVPVAKFFESNIQLMRSASCSNFIGNGENLTNLNLNPFVNQVWFENGAQQAFKVGADSGASSCTTNTEKSWFLTAPAYHDQNIGVGLMQYLAPGTTTTMLQLGYAQGFGSPNQVNILVATNSAEQVEGGAGVAQFRKDGISFYQPVYADGRGMTNLSPSTVNFIPNSFSGWITNLNPVNGWTNYTMYTNGIVWTNSNIPL